MEDRIRLHSAAAAGDIKTVKTLLDTVNIDVNEYKECVSSLDSDTY